MKEENKAMAPVEERIVEFYGDEIKGVVIRPHPAERQIFIPVRPLCEFLGVNWSTQRRRIINDAVLSREVEMIMISTAGGPQEALCIPLDMLNGWLFSINANRVKDEIRDRLIRYQKECYRVLATAFQTPTATDPLAQVEELGRALITLAREQREFDSRLVTAEDDILEVRQRVVALEEKVAPGEPVTEEQASHISQAVKAIAYKLSERTGRNEYGGVYSELYKKFGVTSYKLIPAARYKEAIEFLTEWWHQITKTDEIPF